MFTKSYRENVLGERPKPNYTHLEPGCVKAKKRGCTCYYMPEQKYTKAIKSGCPIHDTIDIVIRGSQPWVNRREG